MTTLVELVDRFGGRDRLRAKLVERTQRHRATEPSGGALQNRQRELQKRGADLGKQVETAKKNMALESDPELSEAVRDVYIRVKKDFDRVQGELRNITQKAGVARSLDDEIEAAMGLLDQIRQVATEPRARAEILPTVQRLGLRIGLRFVDGLKGKKRQARRLVGGVLAFGDAPFPMGGNEVIGHYHPDGIQQPDSTGGDAMACQTERQNEKDWSRNGTASMGSFVPTEANQSTNCLSRAFRLLRIVGATGFEEAFHPCGVIASDVVMHCCNTLYASHRLLLFVSPYCIFPCQATQ